MRIIPTRVHAMLDYGLGIVIVSLPYILGIADRGMPEWIPVLLGIGLIGYSAFTNYEFGLIRLIPLRVHLALDIAGGVALIAFAAVFVDTLIIGFVFVVLGIIEIASGFMTKTVASDMAGVAVPPVMERTSRSTRAMPLAHGPSTADGRPAYATRPEEAETVEQLRAAIDSGHTHDKIAVTDPAAAPLGSDAEAADLHDEQGLELARRVGNK